MLFFWPTADRDRALKRAGGRPVFSMDARDAEAASSGAVPRPTPEQIVGADWAMALMARVFDALERHYAGTGRSELFRRLNPWCARPQRRPSGRRRGRAGADRRNLRWRPTASAPLRRGAPRGGRRDAPGRRG